MINYYINSKNYFLWSIVLLLVFIKEPAQAQDHGFAWVAQMGSWNSDYCNSFTRDNSGNTYITGSFMGTVDFDPGPGTYSLSSTGVLSRSDIFILKLDAQGNFIWAKQMGGDDNDESISIATDASGNNIFLTGSFQTTADFDPGAGTSNLTAQGGNDIFIAKLTGSGNFVWAKQIGSTSDDKSSSLFLDASGNPCITGSFQGAADFDPGIATVNLTPSGTTDMFILKLDASGNFTWVKQIGGTTYAADINPATMTKDGLGNIYITGSFTYTIDFDPGASAFNLISMDDYYKDIFILKLDASGNLVWVKQMGGHDNDMANAITIDGQGNVYSTGSFYGEVDFDPGAGTSVLAAYGSLDVYISKLDASGNFVWAKQVGYVFTNDNGTGITTDINGNVYCTGNFSETVDFDPGAGTYELTAVGDKDIFLLKLTSAGNFTWAKKIGGTGSNFSSYIRTDPSDNIYISGNFSSQLDANPGAGTHILSSEGNSDGFILKLQPCSPTSSIATASACESYTWIDGITYTSSTDTPTFSLQNARGCDSVITLHLTIHPKPVTSSVTGERYPVKNTIKTYSVTATSGSTYQWVISNGTQQSGGTTNSISVKWASSAGEASIKVIETNSGCTGDEVTQAITIVNKTGIADNSVSKDFKIMVQPNPSEDVVYLHVYNQQDKAEGNLRITDINGRILAERTATFSTGETMLELNEMKSMNAGLYFLYVTNEEGTQVIKMIKTN